MIEKPLERLHYFNGQRLEASDLKTEQDYHIRVRRWLNKSLYSAGIAEGLEVRSAGTGRFVIVSPGLALDSIGREIIVLEEETVEVFSYAGTDASTVEGNYLVIEYSEERTAFDKSSGCVVRHNGSNGGNCGSLADGPSRVQARPKFSCVRFPPPPGSNQVALARIELADNCSSIGQIDPSIRYYIGPASQAKVRQYALEGEREVAAIPTPAGDSLRVDARIYFHVRGRQPTSVTLYLKAEELSALHYTELAEHEHSLSVDGGTGDADSSLEHQHLPGGYVAAGSWTDGAGDAHTSDHNHSLLARVGYIGADRFGGFPPAVRPEPAIYADDRHAAFFLIEREWGVHIGGNVQLPPPFNGINDVVIAPETDANTENDVLKITQGRIESGSHEHAVTGNSGNSAGSGRVALQHKHSITGTGTSGRTGTFHPSQPNKRARVGQGPLTFVRKLRIALDGSDQTNAIRDQIVDLAPGDQKTAWESGLGDGTGNHPLAHRDAEALPIRLDFLRNVTFREGQHVIDLSVELNDDGSANGGRILYNLYVE